MNDFLSSQPEGTKKDPMTMQEVAMGFVDVANETMCRPIRALTQVSPKAFYSLMPSMRE